MRRMGGGAPDPPPGREQSGPNRAAPASAQRDLSSGWEWAGALSGRGKVKRKFLGLCSFSSLVQVTPYLMEAKE